jgi:hypothetical protein
MRRDNARWPAELQAETSMLFTEAASKVDRAFLPLYLRGREWPFEQSSKVSCMAVRSSRNLILVS